MMAGKADIVSGLKNKLQAAAAHVLPEAVTAGMHRTWPSPVRATSRAASYREAGS